MGQVVNARNTKGKEVSRLDKLTRPYSTKPCDIHVSYASRAALVKNNPWSDLGCYIHIILKHSFKS